MGFIDALLNDRIVIVRLLSVLILLSLSGCLTTEEDDVPPLMKKGITLPGTFENMSFYEHLHESVNRDPKETILRNSGSGDYIGKIDNFGMARVRFLHLKDYFYLAQLESHYDLNRGHKPSYGLIQLYSDGLHILEHSKNSFDEKTTLKREWGNVDTFDELEAFYRKLVENLDSIKITRKSFLFFNIDDDASLAKKAIFEGKNRSAKAKREAEHAKEWAKRDRDRCIDLDWNQISGKMTVQNSCNEYLKFQVCVKSLGISSFFRNFKYPGNFPHDNVREGMSCGFFNSGKGYVTDFIFASRKSWGLSQIMTETGFKIDAVLPK